MTCWAVVVAAGRGCRTGLKYNKVFYRISGRSVLSRSLDALEAGGVISGIVLVLSESDFGMYDSLCREEGENALVKKVVTGGETRQESVYNGLLAVPDSVGIVAIHDAARAFVPVDVVKETVKSAVSFGSGVAATRITDTVKVADDEDYAAETLDRSKLRAVQTPQTFNRRQIVAAHESALRDGFCATDDAALYERYIAKSRLVICEGSHRNVKLTTMEDLRMIERELAGETRVGYGFDAHRLVNGRKLVLCGVEIPYEAGLYGHSDADVATHALMDALLSSASMGDIGRMFPDTDASFKDIYSIELLKTVMRELRASGYSVVNADVTIIAQKPKLADYMESMRNCLSEAMKTDVSRISVKATTTERMGYEGRSEGISAAAVALVRH